MKILVFDCSKFGYELDHSTGVGEEAHVGDKENFVDCLVIFVTFENKE